MKGQRKGKIFRDPIYGYIEVTPQELAVITLPVFQRLRFITQLSFCDLAYPEAKHSRFGHSLGVMHLCGLYADHLAQFNLMDEKKLRRLLRLAGLLHDIGHWPFSHAAEPAFSEFVLKDKEDWWDSHVRWGQKVITNKKFGISKIITAKTAREVACLIVGRGEEAGLPSALNGVLKGLFSADRIDYLKRDALHAGTTEYSILDVERIIRSPHVKDKKIYHLRKCLFALEGAVLSYAYMYRALYYHHVSRGATCVFESALHHAFTDGKLNTMIEQFVDPDFFVGFTDCELLGLMNRHGGTIAKELVQSLRTRRIPRCLLDYADLSVYEGPLGIVEEKITDYPTKRRIQQAVAERLNGSRTYIDTPRLIAYIPPGRFKEEPLIIADEEKVLTARRLSRESPVLQSLFQISPIITRIYIERDSVKPDKNEVIQALFDACDEIN